MSDQSAKSDPAVTGGGPSQGFPTGLAVTTAGRRTRLLSEAIALEEERIPAFARFGLLFAGLIVALFVVWASVVRLDELAMVPGEVVPSASVQIVQHLEGGVVSEVLVKEGELVRAGQPLIRFDGTQVGAELEQVRARRAALEIRAERLSAVAEGREPDFSGIPAEYADLVADQIRIYRSQIEAHRSALDVLNVQIQQRSQEIEQLRGALETAKRHAQLTGELLAMRQELLDKGLVNKVVHVETERAKVTADGEVVRLQEQIKVATQAHEEVVRRQTNMGSSQRQDALGEMGTVTAELAQVKNQIARLQDRYNRLEVMAPVTGVVQDLKVRTPGEVLQPGGLVTRLVPRDDVLEVEVRIPPRDIGHIHVGQPVKVKVSSYDFARYGHIPGEMVRLSPATFATADGQPYYKGVIRLHRAFMGPGEGENPILPGMVVEADILTGSKTLVEYLLKPIFVSLDAAFRER